MSDPEAIMWAVEKDPALRSDFCNVTLLEGAPTQERLLETARRALDAIPRLRHRVVSAPLRIVPPEWVEQDDVDLEYHVRRVTVPAPGGLREALDLAAAIAEQPFDRARPLWEFTLIDGLADGRAILLQKVHHTITDGVGGLKLSLALVTFEPDAPNAPPATITTETARTTRSGETGTATGEEAPGDDDPTPVAVGSEPTSGLSAVENIRDALADATVRTADRARGVLSATGELITHPQDMPARAADAARLAASVRRQVFVTEQAHSPLIAGRSLQRHFELFTTPMAPVRALAKRQGVSINDVFVTGVTGALGLYHERMGVPCETLRMAMPVSLRGRGEAAANRFAPSRVVVPIMPIDPERRLSEVCHALAMIRSEPALAAAESLAGIVSGLPTSVLVRLTRAQTRTIDFATSNLRGSAVPLYVAGQRIVGNFPLGPRAGCALNVTMLSYCDQLDMGLNIDPAAITDIALLMESFSDAFSDLAELAGR